MPVDAQHRRLWIENDLAGRLLQRLVRRGNVYGVAA